MANCTPGSADCDTDTTLSDVRFESSLDDSNLTSLSVTVDLGDLLTTLLPQTDSSNYTGNMTRNFTRPRRRRGDMLGLQIQIPIYVLIFLLSVVGNVLVLVTLAQNKKMRTVTNVFLLNLAVSDLLLAVFCMPFTLIPILLQNFIFGAAMCVMIRYLQGVSVSVSCFTLVAISLERYFAICRPLHSRSWQTLSHAYKAIAVCWLLAFFIMIPLAVYHELRQIGPTAYVCVEVWDSEEWKKTYTMLLNILLLILPIILMSLAYGCVCYTLWIGMKLEAQSERDKQQKNGGAAYSTENGVSLHIDSRRANTSTNNGHNDQYGGSGSSSGRPFRRFEAHRAMRQSNSERSRAAKKRVIKMLFMIVVEFFIFWTPLYVITTWIVFDLPSAQQHISSMVKALFHLLSYVSACCNPITYCFMNKNFRQGFIAAFRCLRRRHVYASRRSEYSFSGHTASTRTGVSHVTTNYDKIRDSDDLSEKSF